MAGYHQDWDDLGRSIQETVDRAINSRDFARLSRTIRQIVDTATDFGEEMRQAKAQRTALPEPPKPQPVLYGPTGGKLAGGILKTVGGGISSLVALGSLIWAFAVQVVLNGAGLLPMLLPLSFTGVSALLLGTGVRDITRLKRFRLYRMALGQKTHCALEKLARSVGKTEKFVRKELLEMIDEGLFLEGHLDAEGQSLITSDETYRYYEQSRLQLEQRRQAQARQAPPPQSTPEGHSPQVREVLERGDAFLAQIRQCNDDIPGEEISEKISRMETIVERIFDRVETYPEAVDDLEKLMNYYLPMTVKLLRAYADMDAQPVQGENIQTSKREIEQTLDTLNQAFEKLLDELFEDTALDISSDISVLQTLLAQEGLTEDALSQAKKNTQILS